MIRFSLVREGKKALSDIFEAERFCDIQEKYYDFRAFVIFFRFGIVRVIRHLAPQYRQKIVDVM